MGLDGSERDDGFTTAKDKKVRDGTMHEAAGGLHALLLDLSGDLVYAALNPESRGNDGVKEGHLQQICFHMRAKHNTEGFNCDERNISRIFSEMECG